MHLIERNNELSEFFYIYLCEKIALIELVFNHKILFRPSWKVYQTKLAMKRNIGNQQLTFRVLMKRMVPRVLFMEVLTLTECFQARNSINKFPT